MWYPIESAHKDGTIILLGKDVGMHWPKVQVGYWHEGAYSSYWRDENGEAINGFTHWASLEKESE